MLKRYTRYKQITRVQLYGDDDTNANSTTSQYILPNYINSITVTSGGSGYGTEQPELIFVGGGGGNGLAAIANLTSGAISSVTITRKGTTYFSNPTIRQRHSTVGTLNTTVTITNAGAGYPNNVSFPLSFSGGGGFEASGFVTTNGSGAIGSVTISTRGYNYTSAPTLSIVMSSLIPPPTTVAVLTPTIVGTLAVLTIPFSPVTNGKKMRFDLNGQLGEVQLSRNARAILEMACIPSFSNAAGQTAILRLMTATQDKVFDTKKFSSGYPILFSMPLSSTVNTLNTLYNNTTDFHNLSVPSNFLSNGCIECELEFPAQQSTSIDFITNQPLRNLYINLIIVDEDDEETKDINLAPPIDMKNYNINMPIRPY